MANDVALRQEEKGIFMLIPLSEIEPNEGQMAEEGLPENPREIDKVKFDLLKKNITDYPEWLQYNMLKVYQMDNGRYITIGGNMRYRALKELSFEKAPCAVLPHDTPIDRLRAYAILDNNSFGKYDWSSLANNWDSAQLTNWGVDLPTMESDINPDDFFNEIDNSEEKEKGHKISVTLPSDFTDDEIKEVKEKIKDALSGYDGIKVS